ncbi:hypothetical protein PR002_g29795 [Phytophthora rubi]|uniref:Uncharacterized protein n=1 Tax=Phytophthora rubi TaxID=129364 RepID=A0A6A3GXL2_9STRA|nr:hypothetical protein PR002_g29795 [Phytophthora rubi]
MAKSPPKKQPRLDEAEAATLTTPASVGSGASQTQSVRVDEIEQKAAWVESTTLPFPTGLPMEHEYLGQKFYVRSCYSDYYEYVMGWLDYPDTEVVTITGTPGIGKSIFCAYFLKRFSFEDKEATIITASFSRNSVLTQVTAWKGGEMLGSAVAKMADSSAMSAVIENAERQATHKLIYLIDGPPKFHPKDAQTVVFVSPNDAWFSYIRKDATRPKVVMPLWTMKELEAAAIKLDLTMRVGEPKFDEESMGALEDVPVARIADLVEQRFHVFGGVARECLSADKVFVKEQQDRIQAITTRPLWSGPP